MAADTPKKQSYTRGMFQAYVDNALAERRQGKNANYNDLYAQFKSLSNGVATTAAGSNSKSATPSAATLRSWIEALTHVVAQLDRSHSSLVDSVLSLPWTTMDDGFGNTYMRFVQALLCARSEFVSAALEKIVKGFRFQVSNVYVDEDRKDDPVTRRITYEKLHHLLRSLIHLIPTLPSTLWPFVNRYFPHKRENRNSQVVYITNALKIIEYCPQLGENILNAVILRAVQIDVEIQVDIDDLEDDEGLLDEEIFGFNPENPFDRPAGEDDDSDSDSDDDEGGLLDPDAISSDDEADENEDELPAATDPQDKVLSPQVIKHLKEMAAKLDAILKVIFGFLDRLHKAAIQPKSLGTATHGGSKFAVPDEISIAYQQAVIVNQTVFTTLISIFNEKILRTFRTRHTQFVLFWYSSLSSEYTDVFIGGIIAHAQNAHVPVVTRVAASGYVASYVSRALTIDANFARRVMALLCDEIGAEMDEILHIARSNYENPTGTEKTVKSSVVFYAFCQAAFYIFCFRWKDFLDEAEDEDLEFEGVPTARRWLPALEVLKEAINSALNPLKMCSSTVVTQFARMAHKTDFMYCHSIIEANKRETKNRRYIPIDPELLKTPTNENGPASSPFRSATQPPRLTDANLVSATLKEAQIDSHFPFDPYKLPLSASYIKDIYRNWESGDLDESEDEDENATEDSEDEEDDDDDEEGTVSGHSSGMDSDSSKRHLAVPGSMAINGAKKGSTAGEGDISYSFEAMSVSPNRTAGILHA